MKFVEYKSKNIKTAEKIIKELSRLMFLRDSDLESLSLRMCIIEIIKKHNKEYFELIK